MLLRARQAVFFGLLFFWASKRKVTRLPAGSRNARRVGGNLAVTPTTERKSLVDSLRSPLRGRPTGVLRASRLSPFAGMTDREREASPVAHRVRSYRRAGCNAGWDTSARCLRRDDKQGSVRQARRSAVLAEIQPRNHRQYHRRQQISQQRRHTIDSAETH